MGTARPLRPCGLCLVAVLAFVPPLRVQAPAKADVLPPVSVDVVRIDAVVTDKGGRPKPGLAREEFAVLEDGVPQKLVQFEAYARLTLETLERLTWGLARLPGRKLIFLLSDGFLTGLSAPGGAGSTFAVSSTRAPGPVSSSTRSRHPA